jgi:hypothetical protein
MLKLLLVLLSAAPVSSQNIRLGTYTRRTTVRQNRLGSSTSLLLSYMEAGRGGAPSTTNACDILKSKGLLTGAYYCLKNDGTSYTSAGMTPLTLHGVDPSQTISRCPNGLNCTPSVRQELDGSTQYWSTPSPQTAPTSDFTAFAVFSYQKNPTGIGYNPSLVGKWVGTATDISWLLEITASASQINIAVGDTASHFVSHFCPTVLTMGAIHTAVMNFHYSGHPGVADSTGTIYLDGTQCGTWSDFTGPVYASTQPHGIGARGNGTNKLPEAIYAAGFIDGANLSASTVAEISSAANPIPAGTRGEQLSFARTSAASCTAPDGTVTWLPPNRPCISGGVRVRPATTNLLTFSEQFDNAIWVKTNSTVTQKCGDCT